MNQETNNYNQNGTNNLESSRGFDTQTPSDNRSIPTNPNELIVKEPVIVNQNEANNLNPDNNQVVQNTGTNNIEQNNIPNPQQINVDNSQNINGVSNNYQNATNSLPKQKPSILKYYLIAFVGIIVIVGGALFSIKYFKSNNNSSATSVKNYSNAQAFFLSTKDSEGHEKYALFNIDGDKITDFIYDRVSEFFNGVASVEKDNEYALISTSGKEIVKFGTYSFISSRYGGLYLALAEDGKHYVIDSNGKKIYTYTDDDKNEIEDFIGSDLYSYIIDGTKIILFNVEGKKMKEYTIKEEANSKGSSSDVLDDYFGDDKGLYSSIYYDGNLTIFDNSNFSVVYDGKLEYPYVLRKAAYDNKSFLLAPVTYVDIEEGHDLTDIIIYNKKQIKLNFEDVNTKNNYIYGRSLEDDTNYIINPDGTKGVEEDLAYLMDVNNYVLSPSSSHTYVEFYKNGKMVKRIEDEYVNDDGKRGVYLVHLKKDDYRLTWYNTSGERVLDESYYRLFLPDSNDRAIAMSEKDGSEILIDINGKKVSQEYDSIIIMEKDRTGEETKYYCIEKDSKYGIMDKDGNIIIEPKYIDGFRGSGTFTVDKKGNVIVLGKLSDDKAEIYSSAKKVIVSNKPIDLRIYDYYITSSKKTSDGYQNDYYNFDGEKIHSN